MIRTRSIAVIVTVVAALFVASLPARSHAQQQQQAQKGWQQVKTADAPPARYDHVLISAGALNRLVLFGGRADKPLADTWIFDLDKNTWREVKASPAPEARFGMGADYDAARKRVLLFAGQQSGFFNDVWAFDVEAEKWSEIETSGSAPPARYGTSAVIDPKSDVLIISHGFASGRFDDTFALDLKTNTWKDVSPATRPLKRCLHESVYDTVNGKMILFGGCSSGFGPCPQGDLWSFDPAGNTWSELKANGEMPSARSNPGLVFDPAGTLWLFGGKAADGNSDELWALDPKTGGWKQHNATEAGSAPSKRYSHDATWDSVGKQLIVFGGRGDTGPQNDLWIYKP
jgi:hypothetical protein